MAFLKRLMRDIQETLKDFRNMFRDHPLMGLIAVVALLFGLGGSLFESYKKSQQEQTRQESLSYMNQLSSLENVEKSLEGLLAFVDKQKHQLREHQDLIKQLDQRPTDRNWQAPRFQGQHRCPGLIESGHEYL